MAETTEQKYLELAEECKNIVEEKDKLLRKYQVKYMDNKKDIAKIYGLIKTIQENITDQDEADIEFVIQAWMIAEIRGTCSDNLFEVEEKELDIYGY